jgi:DNA invertase Pin-like site-specific DNA recombinase
MSIFGYARVSTADQSMTRQIDELTAAGCERIWSETASGKRGAHRPEWDAVLSHLRAGDTLTVVELSRLGRNTADLAQLAEELDARKVFLRILNLGLDTSTASGRLIYAIVAAVSAMERELLIERTNSGLAAARARGRKGGRRQSITPSQIKRARQLHDEERLTMAEIAAVIGFSPATLHRHLAAGQPVA